MFDTSKLKRVLCATTGGRRPSGSRRRTSGRARARELPMHARVGDLRELPSWERVRSSTRIGHGIGISPGEPPHQRSSGVGRSRVRDHIGARDTADVSRILHRHETVERSRESAEFLHRRAEGLRHREEGSVEREDAFTGAPGAGRHAEGAFADESLRPPVIGHLPRAGRVSPGADLYPSPDDGDPHAHPIHRFAPAGPAPGSLGFNYASLDDQFIDFLSAIAPREGKDGEDFDPDFFEQFKLRADLPELSPHIEAILSTMDETAPYGDDELRRRAEAYYANPRRDIKKPLDEFVEEFVTAYQANALAQKSITELATESESGFIGLGTTKRTAQINLRHGRFRQLGELFCPCSSSHKKALQSSSMEGVSPDTRAGKDLIARCLLGPAQGSTHSSNIAYVKTFRTSSRIKGVVKLSNGRALVITASNKSTSAIRPKDMRFAYVLPQNLCKLVGLDKPAEPRGSEWEGVLIHLQNSIDFIEGMQKTLADAGLIKDLQAKLRATLAENARMKKALAEMLAAGGSAKDRVLSLERRLAASVEIIKGLYQMQRAQGSAVMEHHRRLAAHDVTLDDHEQRIRDLERDIGEIRSDLDGIRGQISGLNRGIGTSHDPEEIAGMRAEIDRLKRRQGETEDELKVRERQHAELVGKVASHARSLGEAAEERKGLHRRLGTAEKASEDAKRAAQKAQDEAGKARVDATSAKGTAESAKQKAEAVSSRVSSLESWRTKAQTSLDGLKEAARVAAKERIEISKAAEKARKAAESATTVAAQAKAVAALASSAAASAKTTAEAAKAATESVKTTVDGLRTDFTKMQAEQEAHKKVLAAAWSVLRKHNKQISELFQKEAQLRKAMREGDEAQAEALKAAVRGLKASIKENREHTDAVARNAKASRMALEIRLGKRIQDVNERVNTVNEELQSAKRDRERIEGDYKAAVKAEREARKAGEKEAASQLAKARRELGDRLSAAENSIGQLESNLFELCEALDEEFRKVHETLTEHQEEIAKHTTQIKANKDELVAQKDDFVEQLRLAKERLSTLETSNAEYKEEIKKIAALEGQVNTIKDEVSGLDKKLEDNLAEIAAKFEAQDVKFQQHKDELEAKFADIESALERVNDAIRLGQEEAARLAARIEELDGVEGSAEEVRALKDELAAVNAKVSGLEETAEKHEKSLDSLEGRQAELEESHKEHKRKVKAKLAEHEEKINANKQAIDGAIEELNQQKQLKEDETKELMARFSALEAKDGPDAKELLEQIKANQSAMAEYQLRLNSLESSQAEADAKARIMAARKEGGKLSGLSMQHGMHLAEVSSEKAKINKLLDMMNALLRKCNKLNTQDCSSKEESDLRDRIVKGNLTRIQTIQAGIKQKLQELSHDEEVVRQTVRLRSA